MLEVPDWASIPGHFISECGSQGTEFGIPLDPECEPVKGQIRQPEHIVDQTIFLVCSKVVN